MTFEGDIVHGVRVIGRNKEFVSSALFQLRRKGEEEISLVRAGVALRCGRRERKKTALIANLRGAATSWKVE